MKKFFCFGRDDFCDDISKCLTCDFCNCSGGEEREATGTNADHIRSMTDEELGDFLDSIYCHGWNYGAAHRMDDDPDYHDWLKQPYKEEV